MKNAIIDKLRTTLESRIDSEGKVVYLLCQVRKLLDANPPDPSLFSLRLYCHWALHVDLDKKGTTLPFLKQVDEYVASVYAGGVPMNFAAEELMRREFGFLYTFKGRLQDFLAAYGLPTDVCDDPAQWRAFLQHYAGVIEDGKIFCSAKGIALNHVKEVIFSKGRQSLAGVEALLPFDLAWTIVLLDGKKLTVNANARISERTGEPVISSFSQIA